MEKINFNFVKGDTYTRGFTIENFGYQIEQIYFTVKQKSSDKNFVLQKKGGDGIAIDPNTPNRYILTIDADDTNDFKVGYDYVFDIEIVAISKTTRASVIPNQNTTIIKKTIIGGYLTLEDWDITSKVNEV